VRKIGASASLRQGPSGVEQSRADDFPFAQKACYGVVSATGFSDRGEAVHQAASQVIGRRNGDF
jgi:hypothetical protein